jgi:uncharacterized protein YggE
MNKFRLLSVPLAVLAAAVIVAFAWPAQRVATAPNQADQPSVRSITVNGEGEVKAAPDMARVYLGVQSQGNTAGEAMQRTGDLMNAVLAAVKNAGVPDQDIQTASLSLYPMYNSIGGDTRINGYQASDQLTVTVNDLGRLSAVIDGAIGAGANNSNGVYFGFKDDDGLKRQALVGAAQNARIKAQAVADAMGVSLQGLQSLSEGGVRSPVPFPLGAPAAGPSAPGSTRTPVQPGQLTIGASVTASWIIG